MFFLSYHESWLHFQIPPKLIHQKRSTEKVLQSASNNFIYDIVLQIFINAHLKFIQNGIILFWASNKYQRWKNNKNSTKPVYPVCPTFPIDHKVFKNSTWVMNTYLPWFFINLVCLVILSHTVLDCGMGLFKW